MAMTQKCGSRQQKAVVAAYQQSCRMRHHKADKAQQADNADSAGCEQSCNSRKDNARYLNIDTKTARHLITQLQDVQISGTGKRQNQADNSIRQNNIYMRPAACGKTAYHPHQSTMYSITI